jgi:membrane-associated phospholipid phosphatase
MKGQSAIKLKWSDIPWTLVPTFLWFVAVQLRPVLITPHCADHPDQCTVASLPAMDQPAVGLEAGRADGLSFTTQGLSGIVALAAPPLWHLGTVIAGSVTPMGALIGAATDLVIFAQTTSINGLLTESAHLAVQRPRPFVYADPARARDYSNYTSFYSGHTSFSATATTYVALTLAARGAPRWLVAASLAGAYALMSLTGAYRILAGRHFPTDVLVGALMGVCVAWWVVRRHRVARRESV